MEVIILLIVVVIALWFKSLPIKYKRQRRKEYYAEYLKSDAWRRKRFVVLRRDNWTCQYCGAKAMEVHHKRYARTIGRQTEQEMHRVPCYYWHSETKSPNSCELGLCSERGARSLDLRVMNHATEG